MSRKPTPFDQNAVTKQFEVALFYLEQIFRGDRNGLLLHGTPGIGKTWIVEQVAAKNRVTLMRPRPGSAGGLVEAFRDAGTGLMFVEDCDYLWFNRDAINAAKIGLGDGDRTMSHKVRGYMEIPPFPVGCRTIINSNLYFDNLKLFRADIRPILSRIPKLGFNFPAIDLYEYSCELVVSRGMLRHLTKPSTGKAITLVEQNLVLAHFHQYASRYRELSPRALVESAKDLMGVDPEKWREAINSSRLLSEPDPSRKLDDLHLYQIEVPRRHVVVPRHDEQPPKGADPSGQPQPEPVEEPVVVEVVEEQPAAPMGARAKHQAKLDAIVAGFAAWSRVNGPTTLTQHLEREIGFTHWSQRKRLQSQIKALLAPGERHHALVGPVFKVRGQKSTEAPTPDPPPSDAATVEPDAARESIEETITDEETITEPTRYEIIGKIMASGKTMEIDANGAGIGRCPKCHSWVEVEGGAWSDHSTCPMSGERAIEEGDVKIMAWVRGCGMVEANDPRITEESSSSWYVHVYGSGAKFGFGRIRGKKPPVGWYDCASGAFNTRVIVETLAERARALPPKDRYDALGWLNPDGTWRGAGGSMSGTRSPIALDDPVSDPPAGAALEGPLAAPPGVTASREPVVEEPPPEVVEVPAPPDVME
jgi:hypothetical protein